MNEHVGKFVQTFHQLSPVPPFECAVVGKKNDGGSVWLAGVASSNGTAAPESDVGTSDTLLHGGFAKFRVRWPAVPRRARHIIPIGPAVEHRHRRRVVRISRVAIRRTDLEARAAIAPRVRSNLVAGIFRVAHHVADGIISARYALRVNHPVLGVRFDVRRIAIEQIAKERVQIVRAVDAIVLPRADFIPFEQGQRVAGLCATQRLP